jgi:DNA-binding response OmpR family regulator
VPLFLAKLSAWLRRSLGETALRPTTRLRSDHFHLDAYRRYLVTNEGKAMRLSTLECNLLSLLMHNEGHVLEADTIIDRVWSNYGTGDKALLKNLIYRLRRKIEPDPATPRYIQTVNGQGYVFQVD